jgi:putative lipoprotein
MRSVAALLVVAALAASGCSLVGRGSAASVTGTVTYLLRIALQPDAFISVRLQDTSLQDVPAVLIAEQVQDADGLQVPIPYQIAYDSSQIVENHTYTVSATITEGGAVTWRSTTAIPVITRGAPTTNVEILVEQVP